jgi:hypothetical protein
MRRIAIVVTAVALGAASVVGCGGGSSLPKAAPISQRDAVTEARQNFPTAKGITCREPGPYRAVCAMTVNGREKTMRIQSGHRIHHPSNSR